MAETKVTNNEFDQSAWTSWTPTITAGTGTFITVSASGRYQQIGKTVHFSLKITETSVGTASGSVNFTLPITALNNPSADTIGYGREDAGTGNMMQARLSSPTVCAILRYDNGTAVGAGYVLNMKGTYEAA